MRVPISWLRDFVEFDDDPDELAQRLTFAGLEVESVERVGPDCPGVVVGEIKALAPHPRAPSLQVCRVDVGPQTVNVVCGAPNVRVGDRAPYAPPGCRLPGGRSIEEAVIREERSVGMLCAEDELGIGDDHGGLMQLPGPWAPGTPLSAVVRPEPVLVIEVTPNRPDCLSIAGIAREIAALRGAPLRIPPVEYPESDVPVDTLARVEIRDPERCPRYTARVLSGLRIGPSPLAMRMRLLQSGVRPISNVVDATNYVMLELGQPLHAFDLSLIRDRHIIVRRAAAGETMATLDGVARPLTADMLVIADAERPVALAGVMGGAGSEIRGDTRDVLLESACFQPAGIRRTSKALGLSTESSYRYERGVDPNLADAASRRAAQLIVQTAGASAARGVIDAYPGRREERRIDCRHRRVRDLLGVDVDATRIAGIFGALGLGVEQATDDSCSVRVPTFRPDLEIEADLIEEVARIHGLDRIPARAPRSDFVSTADDAPVRAASACREALAGLGLSEIVNYSFVSEPLLDRFDPSDRPRRIGLPNPVSADQSILRPSLVPQMVATLGYNLARQTAEAALYETGRVFLKAPDGRLTEEERLAVGLLGPVGRGRLDKRRPVEADEVFLWLKGILEALVDRLHAGTLVFEAASVPWAEEGWAVAVQVESQGGRTPAGWMGVVRTDVRSEWRMARPVAVLEARLEPLVARAFATPACRPIPTHPSVTRDVALIVDASVRHDDVLRALREGAPPELTRIELFDIYQGRAVGAGRKSLAFSLTYQCAGRTLTDEEANALHAAVKARALRELKAEARES